MRGVKVIYFGCESRRELGHHLFMKNDNGHPRHLRHHKLWCDIDGRYPPPRAKAGKARLVWVDGHTIIAFHDYSADSRPGSNSAFIAAGRHDAETLLSLAREQWPEMWDRFNFEIEVIETQDLERQS